MGSTVVKVAPGRDLYLVWSSITETPHFVGDRADLIPYLYQLDDRKADRIPDSEKPETRVARADETGTSALWGVLGRPRDHAFDAGGTIYQQQGYLPRANYAALADRILLTEDWDADMRDLLRPFEDGCRCDHAYASHTSQGCGECSCPMTVPPAEVPDDV